MTRLVIAATSLARGSGCSTQTWDQRSTAEAKLMEKKPEIEQKGYQATEVLRRRTRQCVAGHHSALVEWVSKTGSQETNSSNWNNTKMASRTLQELIQIWRDEQKALSEICKYKMEETHGHKLYWVERKDKRTMLQELAEQEAQATKELILQNITKHEETLREQKTLMEWKNQEQSPETQKNRKKYHTHMTRRISNEEQQLQALIKQAQNYANTASLLQRNHSHQMQHWNVTPCGGNRLKIEARNWEELQIRTWVQHPEIRGQMKLQKQLALDNGNDRYAWCGNMRMNYSNERIATPVSKENQAGKEEARKTNETGMRPRAGDRKKRNNKKRAENGNTLTSKAAIQMYLNNKHHGTITEINQMSEHFLDRCREYNLLCARLWNHVIQERITKWKKDDPRRDGGREQWKQDKDRRIQLRKRIEAGIELAAQYIQGLKQEEIKYGKDMLRELKEGQGWKLIIISAAYYRAQTCNPLVPDGYHTQDNTIPTKEKDYTPILKYFPMPNHPWAKPYLPDPQFQRCRLCWFQGRMLKGMTRMGISIILGPPPREMCDKCQPVINQIKNESQTWATAIEIPANRAPQYQNPLDVVRWWAQRKEIRANIRFEQSKKQHKREQEELARLKDIANWTYNSHSSEEAAAEHNSLRITTAREELLQVNYNLAREEMRKEAASIVREENEREYARAKRIVANIARICKSGTTLRRDREVTTTTNSKLTSEATTMHTMLQHKVAEAIEDVRRKSADIEYRSNSTDEEEGEASSEEIHIETSRNRSERNYTDIRRAILEQSYFYEYNLPRDDWTNNKMKQIHQQQGLTICLETATILIQVAKERHKEIRRATGISRQIAAILAEEHIPTIGTTWEEQVEKAVEKIGQTKGGIQRLEDKRNRAIKRTRKQIAKSKKDAVAPYEQQDKNIIKIAWHLGAVVKITEIQRRVIHRKKKELVRSSKSTSSDDHTIEPHYCQGITEPQCTSIHKIVRGPLNHITGNLMSGNQYGERHPRWSLSLQAWKEIQIIRRDNQQNHIPIEQQLQQQIHQDTKLLLERLEQANEPVIPRRGWEEESVCRRKEDAEETDDRDFDQIPQGTIITHDILQCTVNCWRECRCRCHDSKEQRLEELVEIANDIDAAQLQLEELVIAGIATDYSRTRVTESLTGQHWNIDEPASHGTKNKSLLRKRKSNRRRKSHKAWYPSRRQQNKTNHAINGNEEWALAVAVILAGIAYTCIQHRRNRRGPDNREMHATHGNAQGQLQQEIKPKWTEIKQRIEQENKEGEGRIATTLGNTIAPRLVKGVQTAIENDHIERLGKGKKGTEERTKHKNKEVGRGTQAKTTQPDNKQDQKGRFDKGKRSENKRKALNDTSGDNKESKVGSRSRYRRLGPLVCAVIIGATKPKYLNLTNQEVHALNGNSSGSRIYQTPGQWKTRTPWSGIDDKNQCNRAERTNNITPTAPWLGTGNMIISSEDRNPGEENRLFQKWVPSRGADCHPCPKCGRECLGKYRPPHMLQDCECELRHHWAGPGTTGRINFEQKAQGKRSHYTSTPTICIGISETQTSIRWPKTAKDEQPGKHKRETIDQESNTTESQESRYEQDQEDKRGSTLQSVSKRLSWGSTSVQSKDSVEDSDDGQLWWCQETRCWPRKRVLARNQICNKCRKGIEQESRAHLVRRTTKILGEEAPVLTRIKRNKLAHAKHGNAANNTNREDREWMLRTVTSLTITERGVKSQIQWWRKITEQAHGYLEAHYTQEDQQATRYTRTIPLWGLRLARNQQPKRHLEEIDDTIGHTLEITA